MKKAALYAALGVGALVLVILVGAATAYLVLSRMAPALASEPAEMEAAMGTSVPLREFITNLADADRPRYVKVSFELVARDEKDAKRLEENAPQIRDAILSVLNRKHSTALAGEAGSSALKAEVQERVNSLLGGPYVRKVLITDLVVQF